MKTGGEGEEGKRLSVPCTKFKSKTSAFVAESPC